MNGQAYFYLEVWSLFGLLGLLLWRTLDLVLFLVPLQSPQLFLNASALLPHFLPVLLIKEGELTSEETSGKKKKIHKLHRVSVSTKIVIHSIPTLVSVQ